MRLAAICAAILTLAASGALAQETPTSLSPASREPSTVGAAWQAPVGHRQPRLSDLPPISRARRSSLRSRQSPPSHRERAKIATSTHSPISAVAAKAADSLATSVTYLTSRGKE